MRMNEESIENHAHFVPLAWKNVVFTVHRLPLVYSHYDIKVFRFQNPKGCHDNDESCWTFLAPTEIRQNLSEVFLNLLWSNPKLPESTRWHRCQNLIRVSYILYLVFCFYTVINWNYPACLCDPKSNCVIKIAHTSR